MIRKLVPALLLTSFVLSAPPAAAFCIKVPEANLRQGPGTQFEKSWEVYKYMPLKRIGSKGDWYKVEDVDGDTHWVYRKLVSETMRCAVVKSKEANVRTGPGTNFAKSPLSPVEQYYSFRVTGSKGSWVKVEDEVFNEGWIYKPLLWIQ